MEQKIFLIITVLLVLFVIFFLVKLLLLGMIPSFKIYPSDTVILKNAEKYNYCKTDIDCDALIYRDACKYKAISVNKENINKMHEEREKWVFSNTNGDCITYRPVFSSFCVEAKCITEEIEH